MGIWIYELEVKVEFRLFTGNEYNSEEMNPLTDRRQEGIRKGGTVNSVQSGAQERKRTQEEAQGRTEFCQYWKNDTGLRSGHHFPHRKIHS